MQAVDFTHGQSFGEAQVMFTDNDYEALLEQAQGAGIRKVITKSGDGVVNHLLAAVRDVFHERDAA